MKNIFCNINIHSFFYSELFPPLYSTLRPAVLVNHATPIQPTTLLFYLVLFLPFYDGLVADKLLPNQNIVHIIKLQQQP